MTSAPIDRGQTKFPTLYGKDSNGFQTVFSTNRQEGQVLQAYLSLDNTSNDTPAPQGNYPKPAFDLQPITEAHIKEAINSLSPIKAPGPNSIGNTVFKQCQKLLIHHLGPIFQATFSTEYYPHQWKESRAIVLRKLNKANYTTPKAYRPIALLDSMSKILSSCVAKSLSSECEQHNLLEANQFGVRPGRTTTDVLHMLMGFVKDAWCKGDIAVSLFLDIKSAFPSVNHNVLVHDMWMCRVPAELMRWVHAKLSNCMVRLDFDDHTLELLQLPTGIDQGCPISPISYLFYNTDLV